MTEHPLPNGLVDWARQQETYEVSKLKASLQFEKYVNKRLRDKLHTLVVACRLWAGTGEPDAQTMLPRRVARALEEIDE